MENTLKNIIELEENVMQSIDLLEVAKGYCEYNFERCSEVSKIGTIINFVLDKQKDLANKLDNINI